MTLTETRLIADAGEQVFGRGLEYTRYVRGMRVMDTTATGTIQARSVYMVELDWTGDELDGQCTCPHFADGHFCKHLVALGLCVIDDERPREAAAEDDDLVSMVGRLDVEELQSLMVELARRDGSVRRELELRAATASGDTRLLADDLGAFVQESLSVRGFIDYRRSFDVARDAESLLDELERCLDADAPEAARSALLKAITRLRKVVECADDSSGVIGDACQRAADLYARACREGQPDGVELAKWLVRFRQDSPGWPDLELADFVDAFDDRALGAYRKAVAALDTTYGGVDRWERFELDRMLLELADHDRDVDRAVTLLSRGDHPSYGAIVARLETAGRNDEAVTWIDRAVEAGRVSGHGGGNDYWLDPVAVARTYRDRDRVDDALQVLRREFSRSPGFATYRQLLDVANNVGRAQDMRTWALAFAREQAVTAFGSGAALVEIALGEGDLDAAWEAANEFGAGHLWQRLATSSADSRPIDAAELYRPGIDDDLAAGANSRLYPDIARRLATMKELYTRGGEVARFDEYLATIRETYKRRPSLMKALDTAGL